MQYYEFADFKIYPVARKIFRLNIEIEMKDRDFDVLIFLISNKSKILSKDDIIKIVWAGTIVEDNSVERAIGNIRKVLADSPKESTYIKTVRGRGYVFIAEVNAVYKDHVASITDNDFPNAERKSGSVFGMAPSAVHILFGFLVLVCIAVFFWNSDRIYGHFAHTIVFEEDFSDSITYRHKWVQTGASVNLTEGIARITVDEMGKGGKLQSEPLEIEPGKPLIVDSRIRVSFNQNIEEYVQFEGVFGIVVENEASNSTGVFYGVKYGNAVTEFEHEGKVTTTGFYLIRDNADILEEYHHCNGSVGPRTEPIWGKWFQQRIVFDPQNERISLFIDGEKKGEFSAGSLDFGNRSELRLIVYPRGAWLHHSIEIDHVKVNQ